MLPEPLHPAVVHFPVVLVTLLPLAAVAAVVLIHRGAAVRSTWAPVVVLALALGLSAWGAVRTGENEEERVESVVPEAALERHEDAAELFLPISTGVLLLTALGLLGGTAGRNLRYAATLSAFLALGQGLRVGHSGGELVYVHGASSAYTTGTMDSIPTPESDDDTREREGDHNRDEEAR